MRSKIPLGPSQSTPGGPGDPIHNTLAGVAAACHKTPCYLNATEADVTRAAAARAKLAQQAEAGRLKQVQENAGDVIDRRDRRPTLE